MATEEERDAILKNIIDRIQEIQEHDPDSLARTEELGPGLDFEPAVPTLKKMFELVHEIASRGVESLSSSSLAQIHQGCTKIVQFINSVIGFALKQDKPADIRQGIIDKINASYDSILDLFNPSLTQLRAQQVDPNKLFDRIEELKARIESDAVEVSRLKEDAEEKAAVVHKASEQAAGESGALAYEKIFAAEANTQAYYAKWWLGWTITTVVLTLAAAIAAFVGDFRYQPDSVPRVIQYTAGKLIILSIMTYAIIWCARNYRARKHNEMVNTHRRNALRTFSAFIEGSSDARVKDAVLLHAAQAVFASRQTGFDAPDKDSQTINPIVEVLGRNLPGVEPPG